MSPSGDNPASLVTIFGVVKCYSALNECGFILRVGFLQVLWFCKSVVGYVDFLFFGGGAVVCFGVFMSKMGIIQGVSCRSRPFCSSPPPPHKSRMLLDTTGKQYEAPPASNIGPLGILSTLFLMKKTDFYGHSDLWVSGEGVVFTKMPIFIKNYVFFFCEVTLAQQQPSSQQPHMQSSGFYPGP